MRRANPRQAASPHLRERGSYLLCQIFFVAIKWLKIEVMNWQIGRRRGTSDISKKLLARARIPPVRAHPGQPLSLPTPYPTCASQAPLLLLQAGAAATAAAPTPSSFPSLGSLTCWTIARRRAASSTCDAFCYDGPWNYGWMEWTLTNGVSE